MTDQTNTPETDEFINYPIGVEQNPQTKVWGVIDGDTFRVIATRYDRAAANAIARKANGMPPQDGDSELLATKPQGDEYGPYFDEPRCVVIN